MNKKQYTCNLCGKQLEEKKPIRLQIQIYGIGRYKQFYPFMHRDLCEECYNKFNNWIDKNKTIKEDQE